MSEKKTYTQTRTNTVKIVGYIKENNLEQITNNRGDNVIRGSLLIATGASSSYKVQFYVSETTAKGEPSKDYASLQELLPENTISVASFLKDNATATAETAMNAATRVWTIARFEEYASRVGERTTSMVTLKGFRAGFSKSDKPFEPTTDFDVEIYINSIQPELDEEEKETGRLLIEGLIPKYDGSVDKVDFVAPVEDNIAKYIKANYHEHDTVSIGGTLVSLVERIAKDEAEDNFFGKTKEPGFTTKFVRERLICRGSKNSLSKEKGEDPITDEFIKEALAKRELKMDQNGERASNRAQSAPAQSAPKPQSTFAFNDVDF